MVEDREELVRRVEDRLSAVSAWLDARRRVGVRHLDELHAWLKAAHRGLRDGAVHGLRGALARAEEIADEVDRDLERDLGAPPRRPGLRREQVRALRRHLQLTAALVPHVFNLDDPDWRTAHDAYERSWDELHGALEATDAPAERR